MLPVRDMREAVFSGRDVTLSRMTRTRRPRPPESLGPAGAAFWKATVTAYDLAPAELVLLGRACRTVDILDAIDAALLDDGVVVQGSMGQPRQHPLLAAKCLQETTLDALVRGMALPFPQEGEGARRSPAAREAAQARWRAQRG